MTHGNSHAKKKSDFPYFFPTYILLCLNVFLSLTRMFDWFDTFF